MTYIKRFGSLEQKFLQRYFLCSLYIFVLVSLKWSFLPHEVIEYQYLSIMISLYKI